MTVPLGYFWGDDGYGLEQAALGLGARVAAADGPDTHLERWRTTGLLATPEAILERVATATMFGGGTLAIVTDPLPMIRSKAGLDALRALFGSVAPGNALVFVDELEQVPSRSKGLGAARTALIGAVQDVGGEARELRAPDPRSMTGWIARQAKELGVALGRGAADEVALRVGGRAFGGDIDRRNQGRLAVGELRKLALLHIDGSEITVDDVRALVAEANPSSVWEFLDALGNRNPLAVGMFDRLIQTTPEPLVIAQLYTRLRQLLDVTDRRSAGEGPAAIVKGARLSPYVAEKLAGMSARWTVPELRRALEGLFALDSLVKAADGGTSTEEGRRLAFTLWLADTLGAR
jgi:DNA polymerase III delta subunit